MPTRKKNHGALDELRGASRLAVEATRNLTDLVEAMHLDIGAGPALLGRPLLRPTRAFTAPIYGAVRGVTGLVGAGLDRALGGLAPLVAPQNAGTARGFEREAVLAALNGVLGDYLHESGNPLAIEMRLRHGGVPLEIEKRSLRAAFPHAGGKLLVLVHGSCLSDRQWKRQGHDHGAALARDLGYTPVYLHYNSGLHISTNGRAFAALLEELVTEWPVKLEELAIVGHSMGGMVSLSACHAGEAAGHRWRKKLRTLVCLGSPHHGAPLERGGHRFHRLLGATPYAAPLARLGRIRSAGVTDMRFGNVLDEHWEGLDRFVHGDDVRTHLALPRGVQCHAIAATKTRRGTAGPLASDGIVPVESALGRHEKPELTLGFPPSHQWIAYGMGHFDLLDRPDVYQTIRSWLAGRTQSGVSRFRRERP